MRFTTDDGPLDCAPVALTVAGWTGRDAAAVAHHVEELAALGVPPPSAVPLFYRVAPALLVPAGRLDVVGPDTSGEAEPFLLRAGGRLWLGVASDHTDRGLEAHSVALSKQVCGKPVAAGLWAFETVADRLDTLRLSSWIEAGAGGPRVAYQQGTLAAIRPLADLLAACPLGEGEAMLCGTLPAIGGVRPAARFGMRLDDPGTGRSLTADYAVNVLPVVA